MQVQVRMSGGLARLAGAPRVTIELAEQSTVADAVRAIESGHPDLDGALSGALTLIGGDHVPADRPLEHGDEVALLLPIAGGSHTPATTR